LILIEDVEQIVYAESNGHLDDDVMRPYDPYDAIMETSGL